MSVFRTRIPGTAAFGILMAVQSVFAQTPPPPGTPAPVPIIPQVRPVQDPGQQLIDEQRERARERQIAQPPASVTLQTPGAGAALNFSPGTPVDDIPEPGPSFSVRHIVTAGPHGAAVVLPDGVSPARLRQIASEFEGHKLGTNRINVLLKRLTDVFVDAGYVTTRALLGPQNLGSGTLTVTIEIGRIEAFTVNGQSIHRLKKDERSAGGGWLTDAGYANAFPASPGDALRLGDIDQGVSQINRLRRNQAEVQILPGQSPGDSVVAINNRPGDRLYYTLGVDNYGSEATGITRYRAGVEADNLIGLQESLSLSVIDSTESNAFVGSFAIPFGRHTFSYTLSDSEYQQVIGTTALLYGRTLSHILGWNYTASRSQANIVNLDATLSWRRTDREVNDFDLNPQHIAVLRVGGNWLHRFVLNDAQGFVTVDAGVSEGLPWLEADHDAHDIARADAHGQFTKLDATASYTLPLPKIGSAQFAYRGVLGLQYANVALYGSEQLFLGGMDNVRGFRSGVIAGDRGGYTRNELAWVNTPAWHDGRIEPYLFLDAGKASLIAIPGFPSLVGTGGGLRAQWQWHRQQLSGELLVGRALTQPAALGPKSTLILGTMNWSY
jgi:hemolysin activation/secretion protein